MLRKHTLARIDLVDLSLLDEIDPVGPSILSHFTDWCILISIKQFHSILQCIWRAVVFVMRSPEVRYYLFDLYDAETDERVQDLLAEAPSAVIRFLEHYLTQIRYSKLELTYLERKSITSYWDINGGLTEVLDNNPEEFQDALEKLCTRKYVRSLLRPLLKKDLKEGRDKTSADDSSDNDDIDSSDGSVTDIATDDYDDENNESEGFEKDSQTSATDSRNRGDDEASVTCSRDEDDRSETTTDTASLLDADRKRNLSRADTTSSASKATFFECRQCNKGFSRLARYNDHMNTHAGKDGLPYAAVIVRESMPRPGR